MEVLGIVEQELMIWVESEGYKLPGILHITLKRGARPIVLLHGFTGNKSEASRLFVDLARRLCKEGFVVLRFDFRCHGDAPLPFEDFSISYAVSDAHNAIKYIMKKTGAERVGVVGLSMGGGVAVKVSANSEHVGALALLSPALDFPSLSIKKYFKEEQGYVYFGALRLKKRNAQELLGFSVMNLAIELVAPTLIIHSVDDELVPISQARDFYRLLRAEKKFVELKKGGHVFNDYYIRQRVIEEVTSWMKRHL